MGRRPAAKDEIELMGSQTRGFGRAEHPTFVIDDSEVLSNSPDAYGQSAPLNETYSKPNPDSEHIPLQAAATGSHNSPTRKPRATSSGAASQQSKAWWRDTRNITSMLVNLAGIMERTDEQLLPAVYAFVGASFNATPTQLGYLTLSRAMVQALASPLGGFAGHYFDRTLVICVGCLLWGIMTAGFAACHSVRQGMIFWAFNGIGLSLVIPNGQSLIADYYSEQDRGKAFGALYLTGAVGAMLGSLYGTNLGRFHPLGIEGWRFAFLSVAAVSITIGLLNYWFAQDPRFGEGNSKAAGSKQQESFGALMKEVRSMLGVPTFLIIVLQGIVGSTPWNAMVFFTLYLQLLNMSDTAASVLFSVFLGGTAIGGLLGGWVGDMAAVRFPKHGRIAVTQFSVLIGVPLSLLLMKGLPLSPSVISEVLYAAVMFIMGLLISWAAPACNNPIFAEIVPPEMRNMIYSFDRSFEMAISALGAPIVGILAERVFGFHGAATKSETAGVDLKNAKALGNALVVCMIVPWLLCFIFYTGLHFTYPRDKMRALAKSAMLQRMGCSDPPQVLQEASTADGGGHGEGETQRLVPRWQARSDEEQQLSGHA